MLKSGNNDIYCNTCMLYSIASCNNNILLENKISTINVHLIHVETINGANIGLYYRQ